MIHKKLFKSIVIISVGLLLFTGCGKKEEPVISEAIETGNGENGDTVDATLGTGDTSGDVVAQQKPEEQGDPANGSDVTGQDNENGLTDDEINAEVIDQTDSIETADYEIIPMEDATMYCTASSANIRKGPNTSYDKVGTLSYAQEITINGKVETADSTWYVIKTDDNTTQMVSSSLLSTTKPQPPKQQKPSGGSTSSGNGNGNGGGSTSNGDNGGIIVDGGGAPGDQIDTSFDWGAGSGRGGLH